MVKAEETVEET